ncbi:MAG: hypothetical protein LBR16_08010 [Treponema sp.]|jgi:hypothetical protein|nr:hypothetical protein [Treponema sp.]
MIRRLLIVIFIAAVIIGIIALVRKYQQKPAPKEPPAREQPKKPEPPRQPEPPPRPKAETPPREYMSIHRDLAGFFSEIDAALESGAVVRIDPFTLLPDDRQTRFTQCLTWSAASYLADVTGARPAYLLRCTVSADGAEVALRVRIIEISTREVIEQFKHTLKSTKDIRRLIDEAPR